MRADATTCGMVEYPRQQLNNLKKHREVWQNPKQALQKALQLVTIRRQSTRIWPA